MKVLKIALFTILTLLMGSVSALHIQVFTNAAHAIDTSGMTTGTQGTEETEEARETHLEYYNLDQLRLLVQKMNISLQGESQEAANLQAKQMMQQYKLEMQHASKGIKLAHQYQLKKIPATVFDNGKYIVFGQTDPQAAIEDYKIWLKQQK